MQNEYYKSLLLQAMTKNDWSMSALANELQVSQACVTRWLSNKDKTKQRKISPKYFSQIRQLAGVTNDTRPTQTQTPQQAIEAECTPKESCYYELAATRARLEEARRTIDVLTQQLAALTQESRQRREESQHTASDTHARTLPVMRKSEV